MRLYHPEMLLLLLVIPVFIGFYVVNRRFQRQRTDKFVRHEIFERLTPFVSPERIKAKRALFLIGLALLVIATARPQYGSRVSFIEKQGMDIVFVIDTSKSMLCDDMAPSRFQNAVRTVIKTLGRLNGDRVGLVAFSGDAFIQTPLTSDYDGFRVLLDAVQVGSIPLPGTNFETAIDKALLTLARGKGEKKGAIVILSDGENHIGDLDAAIARVRENGSVIYSFGFGTDDGGPIQEGGAYKKDRNGEVVITRLDSLALRRLAEETGGEYYTATAAGAEIDNLMSELETFEKTELLTKKVESYAERFQIFLGCALVLLSAEALVGVRKREAAK